MCSVKSPSIQSAAAAPTYAPAPEQIATEPTMADEDKGLTNKKSEVRSKRRGARALRTDLGINSNSGTGLGVPNG